MEPNKPHAFQIPVVGEAIIKCSDGTDISLTVEDGYRYGGSKLKKAFVFDNCPWSFVVMHDRTYFYNRDTKESYVECISPDEILEVSADFVIFANNGHKERTLYSLKDQKPVLSMTDILHYNEESIIWKEEEEDTTILVLYSIVNESVVLRQQVSLFSLDKDSQRLIFSKDNNVGTVDLDGNLDRITKKVSYLGEIVWVGGANIVASYEEKSYGNALYIYNIEDDTLM